MTAPSAASQSCSETWLTISRRTDVHDISIIYEMLRVSLNISLARIAPRPLCTLSCLCLCSSSVRTSVKKSHFEYPAFFSRRHLLFQQLARVARTQGIPDCTGLGAEHRTRLHRLGRAALGTAHPEIDASNSGRRVLIVIRRKPQRCLI